MCGVGFKDWPGKMKRGYALTGQEGVESAVETRF